MLLLQRNNLVDGGVDDCRKIKAYEAFSDYQMGKNLIVQVGKVPPCKFEEKGEQLPGYYFQFTNWRDPALKNFAAGLGDRGIPVDSMFGMAPVFYMVHFYQSQH